MVTDQQVRRLAMLINTQNTRVIAAAKAGMNEKTARKYLRLGKLPSELKKEHIWRTRPDPLKDIWQEAVSMLEVNPGLEAKTIFKFFQRRRPEKYPDGRLRTLQRRIKVWRAADGPAKEVYFPQVHYPGKLSSSDFTSMDKLNITIQRRHFRHLLYHFTLTYSNWETGMVCFSESFESLSLGMQTAFWRLGGVTQAHRTDCLSAAVHKNCNPEEFTKRYKALLSHYGAGAEKTQPASPHENGDIEQRNGRLKRAVEQALMLRGSKDFNSQKEYEAFLNKIFDELNSPRKAKLIEEFITLKPLPMTKLDAYKPLDVKVGPSSTVRLGHNTYSVHSRLIGEWIKARVYARHIEIWYAQKKLACLPRIAGENKHNINYRHIIDWLARKPGAFKNYRYKEDLFPTSRFRMAYDYLMDHMPHSADKEYLRLLYLAKAEGEAAVEAAIKGLMAQDEPLTACAVERIINSPKKDTPIPEVMVEAVALGGYDKLLNVFGEGAANE